MDFLSSRARALAIALAVLVGIAVAPGSAVAQSNGDGSIYSRFGLGTLHNFSSSQSSALGGGAYALRSLNYAPSANPALLSDQVFTRLSAGASYQNIRSMSGDGQSSRLASGTIEALKFSFPILERKLGIGLSYQPYTQRNYRTRRRGEIPVQVAPDTTVDAGYEVNFRGSGGIHRFRGGVGYRLTDAFSVGASLDVLYGILESQRNTEFDSPTLRNVRITDATRLLGVGGTVGAHLSLSDVLTANDVLSLGTAVTLPTTLDGDRVLTLAENQSVSPDTLTGPNGRTEFEGDVSLPYRARFGTVYQPNSSWTITVDGRYEPWSSFTSTFSGGPFPNSFPVGGEDTFTDRWLVSVGTELMPAGGERYTGYFANIAYRLGGYTERMYVQPNGRDVQTYAVTAGFSFPTSLPGTRLDLNLEGGTRGPTTGTLVQDNFYRVSLHVNFGERWFQERRLR